MTTRSAGAALVLLALGFAGGWLGRGMLPGHAESGPGESHAKKDFAEKSPSAPDVKPAGAAVSPDPVDAIAAQRHASIDRLAALSWGTQHGLPIGVNVFMNDGLDPTFVGVYGLSPNEVATLNEAIRAAKDKMYALALQLAKVQPSPDGTRLVVEVPSTTDQGSPIYDTLLQTFTSVLGPDRLQSFNQLSGNNFESGFGSFGLANTRYELTATDQTDSTGEPIYKVSVSSTLPNSNSTSNGTVTLDQAGTFYPLLGHFAPTVFQPHHGPN
jgi:hypothetical protein